MCDLKLKWNLIVCTISLLLLYFYFCSHRKKTNLAIFQTFFFCPHKKKQKCVPFWNSIRDLNNVLKYLLTRASYVMRVLTPHLILSHSYWTKRQKSTNICEILEEKIEQSRSKVWRRKKIPKFEVLSASCNQVNKYLLHYFFLLSRPFISILSYRQFGENELQLTVPKK